MVTFPMTNFPARSTTNCNGRCWFKIFFFRLLLGFQRFFFCYEKISLLNNNLSFFGYPTFFFVSVKDVDLFFNLKEKYCVYRNIFPMNTIEKWVKSKIVQKKTGKIFRKEEMGNFFYIFHCTITRTESRDSKSLSWICIKHFSFSRISVHTYYVKNCKMYKIKNL